eukprot:gene1528-4600_t
MSLTLIAEHRMQVLATDVQFAVCSTRLCYLPEEDDNGSPDYVIALSVILPVMAIGVPCNAHGHRVLAGFKGLIKRASGSLISTEDRNEGTFLALCA